jgi:zinc finger SWIM domain-containing protein 3
MPILYFSSFKTGCESFITAIVDRAVGKLVVKQVCLEHNHPLVPHVYPENRRTALPENVIQSANELIELGIKAKPLLEHIAKGSGTKLTLRDVHNIRAENKRKNAAGRSETDILLDKLTKLLEDDPDAHVSLSCNDNNELKVLLVQTGPMNELYRKFPEVLLIDATYCVNSSRFPLYCLMCVDGNGNGRIVSYAVVADESQQNVNKVLEFFQESNDTATEALKTVVIDKDFNEIRSIKTVFPSADITICKFHVLKAFKRAIGNLQTATAEKDAIRVVVEKLVYSRDMDEYGQHYEALQEIGNQEFLTYYDNNWHSMTECWVVGICSSRYSLGNSTNNRLESHNQKIKTVVSHTATLPELFQGLLKLDERKREECNFTMMSAQIKHRYCRNDLSEDANSINSVCTPYAANLVLKELKLARTTEYSITEADGQFTVKHGRVRYIVQNCRCNCAFSSSQHLPCRHLFSVRQQQATQCFMESDVPERWKIGYTEHGTGEGRHVKNPSIRFEKSGTTAPRTKSKTDKYRAMINIFKKCAEIGSLAGQREFDGKLEMAQRLLDAWSSNRDVLLLEAVGDVQGAGNHDDTPDIEPTPGDVYISYIYIYSAIRL